MSVKTTVNISGMHCGHCVASVIEELREVEGVGSVDVALNKDGVSMATVTSATELDPERIDAAIAEAGYSVVAGG